MSTDSDARELSAAELMDGLIKVLDQVKNTKGIPSATRDSCDHHARAMHDGLHGLVLWLHELLEWAPLSPETRASMSRLGQALNDADSRFHTA